MQVSKVQSFIRGSWITLTACLLLGAAQISHSPQVRASGVSTTTPVFTYCPLDGTGGTLQEEACPQNDATMSASPSPGLTGYPEQFTVSVDKSVTTTPHVNGNNAGGVTETWTPARVIVEFYYGSQTPDTSCVSTTDPHFNISFGSASSPSSPDQQPCYELTSSDLPLSSHPTTPATYSFTVSHYYTTIGTYHPALVIYWEGSRPYTLQYVTHPVLNYQTIVQKTASYTYFRTMQWNAVYTVDNTVPFTQHTIQSYDSAYTDSKYRSGSNTPNKSIVQTANYQVNWYGDNPYSDGNMTNDEMLYCTQYGGGWQIETGEGWWSYHLVYEDVPTAWGYVWNGTQYVYEVTQYTWEWVSVPYLFHQYPNFSGGGPNDCLAMGDGDDAVTTAKPVNYPVVSGNYPVLTGTNAAYFAWYPFTNHVTNARDLATPSSYHTSVEHVRTVTEYLPETLTYNYYVVENHTLVNNVLACCLASPNYSVPPPVLTYSITSTPFTQSTLVPETATSAVRKIYDDYNQWITPLTQDYTHYTFTGSTRLANVYTGTHNYGYWKSCPPGPRTNGDTDGDNDEPVYQYAKYCTGYSNYTWNSYAATQPFTSYTPVAHGEQLVHQVIHTYNFHYVGAQYVPYYYKSVLNYTAYYNKLESNYIPYLWQSTIIQYVNEDQMTLIVKQEQPIS
ncbi:MAG: hypothetical protein ACP5OR_01795 [Candidatus Dormibacteria bacterium]